MPACLPTNLPKVAEWRLSRHPLNISRSRTFLQEQAYAWKVADDTVETAVLLLSELMTNAYRHARVSPGREIGLRCLLGDRGCGWRCRTRATSCRGSAPWAWTTIPGGA